MKKSLLTLPVVCISALLSAQITVTPAGTPAQIATFLSGNGVTITNVNIYGNTMQYGYFTAFNSTLAMNGGFLMTTGAAAMVVGPNNTSSQGYAVGTNYIDTSLTAIEPLATYDVCMIEFDCVPTDDTLYYNYLFGSEEYPEYVGSFNDAFGIFVYGANPAGGNYNDTNMALIPGGIPVSINNINNGANNSGPCMNCAYYLHNVSDTTLQCDGTTTNLMGIIPVMPNQTYHVKIVIGDAMDQVFDSGVFLQAGSFRCSGQPLDAPADSPTSSVSVYPVPATNSLHLNVASLVNPDVTVELHSLDGKTVMAQNVQAVNGVATIDVSAVAAGSYIAEIRYDGKVASEMVMISNH